MRRGVLILGALPGLAVIFYAALFAWGELYTEVVVLRTFDSDGDPHETRLTVVDVAAFEREMRERFGPAYRCFDFIARMSANEIPVRLDPRPPR